MQRKAERREKFHESLMDMLYGPNPLPCHQKEVDEGPVCIPPVVYNVGGNELAGEKIVSSASEGKGGGELGLRMLSRAQRKRSRKKKLKEGASNRRKITGPQPLVAYTAAADGDVGQNRGRGVAASADLQGVRLNAAEKAEIGNELAGEKIVSSASKGKGGGELGLRMLSRAQRKRSRKKKLKEGASNRRKITGPQPLVAYTAAADGDDGQNCGRGVAASVDLQGVRLNAAEKPEIGTGGILSTHLPQSPSVEGTAAEEGEVATDQCPAHVASSRSKSRRWRRRMSKKLAAEVPPNPICRG